MSKAQYLKLLDVAIQTGCSYFTYNVPNTACNKCGTITKHKLKSCPKCGSEDVDYITRIIGYLIRQSSASLERQKEMAKRFYANGREEINSDDKI